MTRKYNKLNNLVVNLPSRVVITSNWLHQHKISSKLAWWYVHSNWLERIGDKAYKKVNEQISWVGAVASVQTQLSSDLRVGAKTALQLLGQTHFVPIQGIKKVILFKNAKTIIPKWLIQPLYWSTEFKILNSVLFKHGIPLSGVIQKQVDGINLLISSPELAILEVLYLIPKEDSFEEALLIMESLRFLRPQLIQTLLEACSLVKVKRLFLFLAEKYQHTWFFELDLSKIELGLGKIVIAGGGSYITKYLISVPKIEEE